MNIRGFTFAIQKHSPEILTGLGIAGAIAATVMAVKSTPKAVLLIQKKKEELDKEKLSAIETVKTTWICYIPTAATLVVFILCMIGASSANLRRRAALTAAYTLAASKSSEYQKKVVEMIGEKKEKEITDAIAKDKLERNPVKNCEVIVTEKGNTLCYDTISGRYFKSDMEALKKAMNELNRQMLDSGYISLNDFYYEIGLKNTSMGDDLGWNANDGLIDLRFSSQLAEDGTPCLTLDYTLAPKYEYSSLYKGGWT